MPRAPEGIACHLPVGTKVRARNVLIRCYRGRGVSEWIRKPIAREFEGIIVGHRTVVSIQTQYDPDSWGDYGTLATHHVYLVQDPTRPREKPWPVSTEDVTPTNPGARP